MAEINHKKIISDHQWLIFSESDNPDRHKRDSALAYQDSFLRYVLSLNDQKQTQAPFGILHFYPIFQPTIYLGAKDKLLPHFPAAIQYLKKNGYTVSLRPHGGLGVVEDSGILNFGLVTDNRIINLSIEEAYQVIIELVQDSLKDFSLKVDAYEIEDSYCPGKYDIVLEGKKVGGIAQRRFKHAVTTAAYIGISGDQNQRGNLMKEFYLQGGADQRFPTINPDSMTTLENILGSNIQLEEYMQLLIDTLHQYSSTEKGNYHDPTLKQIFQPLYQKAYQRSEKIQSQ
ncbi:hypothetical protein HZY91_09600 [Facklamia sp. DSM 111018]|uniref:BPL/LPL catalytic domain-containing protein n=1 Tax=Facklamia lactis TaxID=2749967 RepID=A0ABS0LUS5_9LACT|nr:hypothetical protein [Facklamia lactis]MBG9981403.1 hypothetical protein [Facklamia lactis]MBG9987121.1 hypothetical protein [Facklamia lactis]